jgi:hypothetical protein
MIDLCIKIFTTAKLDNSVIDARLGILEGLTLDCGFSHIKFSKKLDSPKSIVFTARDILR